MNYYQTTQKLVTKLLGKEMAKDIFGKDDPYDVNVTLPGQLARLGPIKGANASEVPAQPYMALMDRAGHQFSASAFWNAIDKKAGPDVDPHLAAQRAFIELFDSDPGLRKKIDALAVTAQPAASWDGDTLLRHAREIAETTGAAPGSSSADAIVKDLKRYLDVGLPEGAARAIAEANARKAAEQFGREDPPTPESPKAEPQPTEDTTPPTQDYIPPVGQTEAPTRTASTPPTTSPAPTPAPAENGGNQPSSANAGGAAQPATLSNTFTPVSPDGIVKIARSHMGHGYYGQAPISRDMGSLTFKDHQFVGDVLNDAGAGDFRHPHKRPEIAAWADPSADIPGWNVVDPPARKGDVLAMARPNNDGPFGTRHGTMGIATGDGDSIAITNGDSVSRGDIGLRDGDEATIRRYANLDDGADGDPVIRRHANLDTADDAFA